MTVTPEFAFDSEGVPACCEAVGDAAGDVGSAVAAAPLEMALAVDAGAVAADAAGRGVRVGVVTIVGVETLSGASLVLVP